MNHLTIHRFLCVFPLKFSPSCITVHCGDEGFAVNGEVSMLMVHNAVGRQHCKASHQNFKVTASVSGCILCTSSSFALTLQWFASSTMRSFLF